MTDSLPVIVATAAIALGAPLLLAALGELISETAGVLNIELEAMMLAGALAAVAGTGYSHGSLVAGFALAAAAGIAVAGLHGLLCFRFETNQVVSGVILNILALGATSFFFGSVIRADLPGNVGSLTPLRIPGLADIPILGPILFDHDLVVYLAYLAIPAVAYLLSRSHFGLRLKAAGEAPAAAAALGANPGRARWQALLVCGALAGAGGAQLVLASLGLFTENVTAGRGFIALAAVIFGRWRPLGTAGAVLLFAAADAFQVRAQVLGIGVPYQVLVALPYLVTLAALAGLIKGMRPPAALGQPLANR